MRRFRRAHSAAGIAVVSTLLLTADTAGAQELGHAAHSAGAVDFPVSCSAPARAEFERGVALLHHMTYPKARETFERAAAIDSGCAMTHWGIAMTLFQPLWPTRPGPAELRHGRDAVARARRLAPPTERERLYVEAAGAFFAEPESPDYWRRIARWERAMGMVHAAFPDDPEAAAFHALAILAVAPVDTASGGHNARAAELLHAVLRRNPGHPGGMHYLVHANDASGREGESPDVVRRYAAAAPRNPHALHMPTHIYIRLGDWDAVIDGNRRAAEAALEYPAGERGQYVWDEFPHAIEYLVYAELQKGDDSAAAAQVERLHATKQLEPTLKTAFHLASTRARLALERHDWRGATMLAPRDPPSLAWDRFTWPEGVTWFARGLGAARSGDAGSAEAASRRLVELEGEAARAGEDLFARNIRMLRLSVDAWIAHARGDTARSVTLMSEAAALEVATPKHAVTPAPTLPAHELLGDLLAEQSRPAAALAAYERALDLYPRRFNTLLGAARAARASGDGARARRYYRELLEVAADGTRTGPLGEARAFLGRAR